MSRIDLDPRDLDVVQKLLTLHVPRAAAYVFGSRVAGRARRFSDLDVALLDTQVIPVAQMEALRDALSASDLVIFVDVIDLNAVSADFRRQIEPDLVALNCDKHALP